MTKTVYALRYKLNPPTNGYYWHKDSAGKFAGIDSASGGYPWAVSEDASDYSVHLFRDEKKAQDYNYTFRDIFDIVPVTIGW